MWIRTGSGTADINIKVNQATLMYGGGNTYTATTSWQRLTTIDSSNSTNLFIDLTTSNTLPAGTVFYIWGAQLEAGSFPTSYISTIAATATRAADVATVSNTNSSIFPTSSFTTINSPFGTAGGGSTVKLVGPTIKRTAIYNGDLPQSQINALTGTDQWWRWRVTGPTFALPGFTTDGNITVDWGDGVVETLTTGVHTFLDSNVYHTIGFRLNSGTYFRPYINENSTYAPRVIAIGPAPPSMKVDAWRSFGSCTSLRQIDGYLDVSPSTYFYLFCSGCSNLTSFPMVNTGSVTSYGQGWNGCSSLTSFPLLNTAAGTDFAGAWQNCSSLTSFPAINTTAATTLTQAWSSCSSLTSFPLINTASVTSFQSAWQNCTNLISFPAINTTSGTTFYLAWQNCSNLTSFPAINASAGTNFVQAWQNCSKLTSFPFINIAAATTFQYAWVGCSLLATFPANVFNTTGTLAANAFQAAFENCALTAASIENILTSLVTNGQSNIQLGLSGGTNAGASTWTANAITAYNTLSSRGWIITRNA
jgi:hypothetical protein